MTNESRNLGSKNQNKNYTVFPSLFFFFFKKKNKQKIYYILKKII